MSGKWSALKVVTRFHSNLAAVTDGDECDTNDDLDDEETEEKASVKKTV